MKKILYTTSLILLAALSISWGFLAKKTVVDLSHYSTAGMELYYDVPMAYEAENNNFKALYQLDKNYFGFREALGFKESGGDYFVVNIYGYLGKYQFGESTLQLLGVNDPELFLNSPSLQEKTFRAYASRNKWVLRNDIKRFNGKYINGVLVTESGILAAAHLAGPGNVKKFLRSQGEEEFNDAFGTSVRYYLKKFSGYDTSNIKAKKNAKVAIES